VPRRRADPVRRRQPSGKRVRISPASRTQSVNLRPKLQSMDGIDRGGETAALSHRFFRLLEDDLFRGEFGQPSLQHRALDLDNIPVQYEERDLPDGVVSEERYRRGVIVGSSLGGGVNDREDRVAPGRDRNRLIFERPLNQLGCYAVLSSGGVGSNIQATLDRWACFGGSYVRRSRRSPLRTAART
jgi:hypothetical protein